MRLNTTGFAVLSFTLLAGCASTGGQEERRAQLESLWLDKKLSITAPVAIPGGQSHVKFMGGIIVDKGKRFEPICRLEVNSLDAQLREIPAAIYPVQSVHYKTSGRGPSSRENKVSRLTIQLQDSSGEVRDVICSKESQSQSWQIPTLEDINAILGPTLRFE